MDKQVEEKILTLSIAMSKDMMDKMPFPSNTMLSLDFKKKQVQKEIESDIVAYLERISAGLKEIDVTINKLKVFDEDLFTPEVLEEIGRLRKDETSFQTIILDSLLDFGKKKAIMDLIGINSKTIQALYRTSVEIYNEGHYKEAASAFSIITLLDPMNYHAWIALGNSEYLCQRYKAALIAYAMASQADPGIPESYFYMAQSHEALKQYDHALNSLDMALFVIGNNPDLKEWVQKAEAHKIHLKHLCGKD